MSNPTANSSCSDQMEPSNQCRNIIALGEKLVLELSHDDNADTLTRWMAHYIAEKIEIAKTAPEDERAEKEAQCCQEILNLWSHRNDLPFHRRPLESFQLIFKALESLDPKSESRRYFFEPTSEFDSHETKFWLDSVRQIDSTARTLIRLCLAKATKEVLADESDWVAKTRAAVAMKDDDLRLINMLTDLAGGQLPISPQDIQKTQISGILDTTEDFIVLLKKLTVLLREELIQIDNQEPSDQRHTELLTNDN